MSPGCSATLLAAISAGSFEMGGVVASVWSLVADHDVVGRSIIGPAHQTPMWAKSGIEPTEISLLVYSLAYTET